MLDVFAAMSRVEMAGIAAVEVFFVTLILFLGGTAALSPIVWFVLVIAVWSLKVSSSTTSAASAKGDHPKLAIRSP